MTSNEMAAVGRFNLAPLQKLLAKIAFDPQRSEPVLSTLPYAWEVPGASS